jgi:hypothetical protein
MTHKIKTRTAEIYMSKDLILHMIVQKNAVVDDQEITNNLYAIRNISHNKPCAKLIDLRNSNVLDKIKELISYREINENTKSCAILTNNFLKNVLNNVHLFFSRNSMSVRFFTNSRHAEVWLKRHY